MSQDQSNKESIIEFNLSEIIPYSLILENNQLILKKGIMTGNIKVESLLLEINKFLSIDTNDMLLKTDEKNDVILYIKSSSKFNREDIISLLVETVSRELPMTLMNSDTRKPLIYLTKEIVGAPLIGSLYFGVIDRGTNLLQIRSITGCPLNCPFCSVDEGPASKSKINDFIVDPDYLIDTYNQVIEEKELKNAEAHLDGQGEPMSYPYLVDFVGKLRTNPITKVISIQTNGWYLNEKLIDELEEVGLSRINLSINTLELTKGKKLSGRGDYPLQKILEMAEYIAESKIALLLAPVWIPSINDEDMESIIEFSVKVNSNEERYPTLGLQNYLVHHQGRNIKGIHSKTFSEFNTQLRAFEKKFEVKNLVLKPYMFNNFKTKMISQPMRINEKIFAEAILPGRTENEIFATAKNRLIHVVDASNSLIGKKIEVKIIRNKHNIYFGKIA
ncbi:MAG: radical SAM protein [Candidatus Heimdallarchaeota archaeon]|nr:radical SAM protein [Candidatus Heimdallarchaeota archaeon]